MSSSTIRNQQANFLTVDNETLKTFIWDNENDSADFTNSTGGEITLAVGTVLGRVGATQKVAILKSASVDGSEIPVGVLISEITIADTVTVVLDYAVKGNVAEEKIILDGADTFDTLIDSRSIRDRIQGDTVGIHLVSAVELSNFDN